MLVKLNNLVKNYRYGRMHSCAKLTSNRAGTAPDWGLRRSRGAQHALSLIGVGAPAAPSLSTLVWAASQFATAAEPRVAGIGVVAAVKADKKPMGKKGGKNGFMGRALHIC